MSKKDASNSRAKSDILSQAIDAIDKEPGVVAIDEEQSEETDGTNSPSSIQPPPPQSQSSLEEALSVMKVELSLAHDTIASQDSEISRLQAKCLQLENNASTGKSKSRSQDYELTLFYPCHSNNLSILLEMGVTRVLI